MKKNRGDEPIGVITHIYMEMTQGNPLCSYLKQTKIFFFLLKIREQEDRSCLGGGGVSTSGRGRRWGKGAGG
jgi:hypothetical protein